MRKSKFKREICIHCENQIEDIPHLKRKHLCRTCFNKQGAKYRGVAPSRKHIRIVGERKSHSLIQALLRYGIINPMKCQVCGKVVTEGHHIDYNKPLLIEWLCHKHHCAIHFGENFNISPIDYSKNQEIIEFLEHRKNYKYNMPLQI